MNEQQVNLDTMSLNDLKALAYDQIVTVEQAQANLKAVNTKIAEKIKEANTPVQA